MSERIWWCEAEQIGRRVRPSEPWGVHECAHELGCMWMDMAPPGASPLRHDPDLDASAGTLYWLAHDDHLGEIVGRRATADELADWSWKHGGVDYEEPFIPDHPHSYIERYLAAEREEEPTEAETGSQ